MGAFAVASPGGRAFEDGGITAGIVPRMADRSAVNSVVYDDAAELEERLPDLARVYEEAGVLAWTVWVPASDERARSALAAAGHVLDAEPMGMAMALDGVEAADDLDLAEASPEALTGVIAESYHWDTVREALVRWGPQYHPYVARAGGEPACTLAIHDHDADAHVTFVGTIERARGRGLAKALLARALADARERGCATTTLVATKMGHPVYARLGYADLGRVEMWERRRPDPAAA